MTRGQYWWGIVGSLVLLAMLAVIYREICGSAVAKGAVSDAELLRQEPAVAVAGDNAYDYFAKAWECLYWPDGAATYYYGATNISFDAEALLTKNSNTFEYIELGNWCGSFLPPRTESVMELKGGAASLGDYLNVGRLLALKVRIHLSKQEYEEAVEGCLSLLRYGELLLRGGDTYIGFMCSRAVSGMGMGVAPTLAVIDEVPDEGLRRILERLNDHDAYTGGFVRAIKGEYRLAVEYVDSLHEKGFDLDQVMLYERTIPLGVLQKWPQVKVLRRMFFKKEATKRLLAEHYLELLRGAALPYIEAREFLDDGEGESGGLWQANSLGRLVFNTMEACGLGRHALLCQAEAGQAAARLIYACQLYRRDKGDYPAELRELVPAFIASVPLDPFDGREFRYDRDRRIIYSAGRDCKDDGGSREPAPGSGKNRNWRWAQRDAVFGIE